MDEAERCHRLAILDRGRIAAEGAPRDLIRGIGAAVVEVQCGDSRAARHALESLPAVRSVTQLGSRLHALVDPHLAAPAEAVRAHLAAAGLGAQVEAAPASLEDVFVAATRMAGKLSA
jgi:ABC-2 type transport system ATP-binding protein